MESRSCWTSMAHVHTFRVRMNSCKPSRSLNICLLAPWYGGSHKRWADELKRYSTHRIEILSLPSVHWKWRMHGAAITLADQFLSSPGPYDMILAEDMMDVAVFSSLIRAKGINIPIATYFHENQISYPVSPRDTDLWTGRDLRYGFINYTSSLVSDRLFFNSSYHRESFIGSLTGFLDNYPDYPNTETLTSIVEKSETLPLGLDLQALDRHDKSEKESDKRVPLLLWNHRREYDKNPSAFFDLMFALKERDLSFELAILGKQSAGTVPVFEKALERLGKTVIHNGEVGNPAGYAAWLWRADILPVTSNQEFFGGSVIEAVYCGCHPILPGRLAYPEHFPGQEVYYSDSNQALDMLEHLIKSGNWKQPSGLAESAGRYAWENLISSYDQRFLELCEN